MADTALRDAERALLSSPSDPETYARWVAAHLRSGGRDPRRAPRAGDEIRDVHGRATPLGQERTMGVLNPRRGAAPLRSYLAQERLPAGRFLAADRKCSRKGDVYVGDVLVTHDLGKPLDTEAQLVVAPPAPGDTAPRRVECKITRLRDGRLSIALPRGEPLVTPDPRRK